MSEVRSRAPGKLILFGEHAVVYGRPAIAVPVRDLYSEAVVRDGESGSGVTIVAVDLNQTIRSSESNDHPLIRTVSQVFDYTKSRPQDVEITVSSTVPMESGFGSGASVSAAIVQALAAYIKQPLTPEEVSAIVYETERIHHGTPSGIDNTVIALATPIYFVRGEEPRPLKVAERFQLVIGDTGIPVPTHIPVGQVREKWKTNTSEYEQLFDEIGSIVAQAADALARGKITELGQLMTKNQEALVAMGVSSVELDTLVEDAVQAGALGAKLSGAGQGGNMIALVTEETANNVEDALLSHGAAAVYRTWVE